MKCDFNTNEPTFYDPNIDLDMILDYWHPRSNHVHDNSIGTGALNAV